MHHFLIRTYIPLENLITETIRIYLYKLTCGLC